MTIESPPVIGDWYKNDSNESFEVVAFDKTKGLAEIQYFDGTVEEIDLESWYESGLAANIVHLYYRLFLTLVYTDRRKDR